MSRFAAPAALATTVVLWASAFAAIREAVEALGWQHLSVLRLALAAVVLGALAAYRRVGWPARRDLPLLALCALSGMTGSPPARCSCSARRSRRRPSSSRRRRCSFAMAASL